MTLGLILDRDGVVNPTVKYGGRERAPGSLDEFRLFAGVRKAVARLAESFPIIVITNQHDVALGAI